MARILIVDDAEQNLLLYQLYLKGDEFEVVTARGGREALEAISKQEFDLVLLDVVMPEMGGIEVCRRLKATPRTASIPVIFFTGRLRDEADKQVAYEAGAVDYLTKPVDKQELVARIRVMLRFRKERASLERKNARLADAVRKGTSLVAAIGEQLDDYRGLLEAHGRSRDGAIILDRDRIVVGVSPAAARMFPELQEGVPLEGCGGVLGRLGGVIAEWDGAAGETEVVELQGQDDLSLRVTIQRTRGAAPLLVLRVADVSEEDRINQRIADRYPDDLPGRIRQMAHEGRGAYRISKFVGRAPALRELTEQVDKLRQSRCTALIASALHYDGPYCSRPFTPIHCGAISPELIESDTIDRAFALGVGATLREEDLPARIRDPHRRGAIPEIRSPAVPIALGPRPGSASMRDKKRDYERRMVVEMLERCGGNKAEACKRLNMAKSTFYRKLKELEIEPFGAADAGGGA